MTYTVEVALEDNEWGNYYSRLTIKHNGEVVAEHTDRGEPEDNSFGRDWSWVAPALRDAYERGRKDGSAEAGK